MTEVILSLPISESSDMWSLAAILAALYPGSVPIPPLLPVLPGILPLNPYKKMTPHAALSHIFITMSTWGDDDYDL